MIKNIIFDLGNVLLDFNPRNYLKNKIEEKYIENVYEAIFKSKEWPMLDRGTITEKEAEKNIITRNKEYENEIKEAFNNWYELLTPIQISVQILNSLKKKGYKLYYLSNFHCAAFDYVSDNYDFFKLFDGGVIVFPKVEKCNVHIS